ncbi:TetR/AcrR family transcriptional regulator [Actinoplanes derwentensis]|uniref:DNA-binding transcriptional regulator, AcrR family n=1 Tax=Actinoplanes derwentensis TaxID=113562 RepID=A0A1H2BRA4_9ACTN|nr:TetR/AcrR family transcriptional regulator [Actinoplanes derwentensis]GID83008.1 TetR family transcriptional regulator [Actinoplanes derwentensis]SDT60572.1 DNA-binding transcriptional regulator, AcrR family [Actinoplanes derwentensis]
MQRRERSRLPAAERRRQILEMTTKLIAERGFWGLSMQDVADGCGLTVPGMLHHVGSKDSLLVAVLEYRDEQDAQSLADKLGRPVQQLWSDGRISLAEVCTAVVARNAEQPEIVRLFAVLEAESLAPGHPAHAYFRVRQSNTLSQFAGLADPAVADPRELAAQVVAMMDGLQIQWLREPETVDLVRAWESAAARLFG